MGNERYCLRHAAGAYWLVDIGQTMGEYRPPLQLNEMGAQIVELLLEGAAQEEIVDKLRTRYEAVKSVLNFPWKCPLF